jgi:hypothetical protein
VDVKTFRGPSCNSHYYLVRVKIRQQINLTNEGRYKKPIKWDMNKLMEPQIKRQCEQEIHSKIDEIEISSDIELEWDNIKTIIKDMVSQVVGTKIDQRNADWYEKEWKEAMNAKNGARSGCHAIDTRAKRDEYEQKRKLAGKICRNKKQKIIKDDTESLQRMIKWNIESSIKRWII